MIGLVWSVDGETKVFRLRDREGGELDAELRAMGAGDLLVERLGQHATSRASAAA